MPSYIQITDDRVHAPLRAALKAGDVAFLRYKWGHDHRFKEVTVTRKTGSSTYIAGRKSESDEMVDSERRFNDKDGIEWGKDLGAWGRDRLFYPTPDLADYVEENEQRRAEELFRKDAVRQIESGILRNASSKTLQAILDLLDADEGR